VSNFEKNPSGIVGDTRRPRAVLQVWRVRRRSDRCKKRFADKGLGAKMVKEAREGVNQIREGHLVCFPRILENNSDESLFSRHRSPPLL
jgi:hypothetical protein